MMSNNPKDSAARDCPRSTTKPAHKDSQEKLTHNDSPRVKDRNDFLRNLSDKDLLTRLVELCGTEREVQLKILIHLIEVDRRLLYLSIGYGSLFEFCTGYLKYSNSAAGRRIRAARCIGRFPRVADMFRDGKINLTAIAMISGILDKENAGEILDWVAGKPFRYVAMLVSRHRPERYLRDRVRPVCIMTGNTRTGVHPESVVCMSSSGGTSTAAAANTAGGAHIGTNPRFIDVPSGVNNTNTAPNAKCKASLTFTPNIGSEKFPNFDDSHAERESERVEIKQKFQLQFAVEPQFMEKFNKIKYMLSTKYPAGITFETVFDLLMDEYLANHSPENRIKRRIRNVGHKKDSKPQKSSMGRNVNDTGERRTAGRSRSGEAATAAPEPREEKATGKKERWDLKKTRHTPQPERDKISVSDGERCKLRNRHIPQSVRDEVVTRDGGRCTFVGPDGRRCHSRWNLEIDHVIPFARGGGNSPDNLRLLCARHNQLEAVRQYGKEYMEKYYQRE